MKSIKIIAVVLFGILCGTSILVAQNGNGDGNGAGFGKANQMENLTDDQKQLLEDRRELIKQNRETFRATLSEEQLVIFENQEFTNQERRNALMSTLSTTQKDLMANNKLNV